MRRQPTLADQYRAQRITALAKRAVEAGDSSIYDKGIAEILADTTEPPPVEPRKRRITAEEINALVREAQLTGDFRGVEARMGDMNAEVAEIQAEGRARIFRGGR